jgi:GNAT superfamily N-acetyltransferase
MTIKFLPLDTQEWLERGYKVLRELRTELSLTEFYTIYNQAKARDEFHLMAAVDNDNIVGVMGYRILFDFVHGKHLYIDDLVTTATKRGSGVGARLLKEAENIAKEHGCIGMRLCTGIENQGAKNFYEREGWLLRPVAYKKKLG